MIRAFNGSGTRGHCRADGPGGPFKESHTEWRSRARTRSAGRTRILSNGAEIAEGNNELFGFRRETGTWKIHRYLFSTNQPPRA